MDILHTELKKFGRVKLNEPLSKHTTFKIGGPARFFITVEENNKLVGLLDFLNGQGLDYFIIGGGSNLLCSDNQFDGVVVKVASKSSLEYLPDKKDYNIKAEAGILLSAVVNLAVQNNLTGVEWAVGIPGTVGGAVRGNAGAMGKDISSVVAMVEVWRDGEIISLRKEECGFEYRDSFIKHNKDAVLCVYLSLAKGGKSEILSAMQDYIKQRSLWVAPLPSAGSFFKNIKLAEWPGDKNLLPELFHKRGSVPAGWLIEQAGAKGTTRGGAKIFDQHGNFIINYNHATQTDVLALIEEVSRRVYNKFKVTLVSEVEILRY